MFKNKLKIVVTDEKVKLKGSKGTLLYRIR